jgi:hypothetical protein
LSLFVKIFSKYFFDVGAKISMFRGKVLVNSQGGPFFVIYPGNPRVGRAHPKPLKQLVKFVNRAFRPDFHISAGGVPNPPGKAKSAGFMVTVIPEAHALNLPPHPDVNCAGFRLFFMHVLPPRSGHWR